MSAEQAAEQATLSASNNSIGYEQYVSLAQVAGSHSIYVSQP